MQSVSIMACDPTESRKRPKMEAMQNTTSLLLLPPMPQGKAVAEDVQWIVIRLSATMAPGDIAAYTDLSECKVKDIIHHFARTEDVNIPVRE